LGAAWTALLVFGIGFVGAFSIKLFGKFAVRKSGGMPMKSTKMVSEFLFNYSTNILAGIALIP
jgi:hypothetical protein